MALGPGPCRSGLIALPGPCLPRRCQMRWCILGRVQAGKRPGEGVFVAVDVHYLPGGAARAAGSHPGHRLFGQATPRPERQPTSHTQRSRRQCHRQRSSEQDPQNHLTTAEAKRIRSARRAGAAFVRRLSRRSVVLCRAAGRASLGAADDGWMGSLFTRRARRADGPVR